jgi:hypothetical protein
LALEIGAYGVRSTKPSGTLWGVPVVDEYQMPDGMVLMVETEPKKFKELLEKELAKPDEVNWNRTRYGQS